MANIFSTLWGVVKTAYKTHGWLKWASIGAAVAVTGGTTVAVVSNNTPDSHQHTYTQTITLPTCVEQGYTTHLCECGESYIDTYVDANGHTIVVDGAVEPTCTKTGLTEGKRCSVCDEVIVAQQIIDANGHTNGKWIVDIEATCAKNGSKHQVCSICADTIRTETIIKNDAHNYNERIIVEADCVTKGKKEYTCTICNDSYIEDFAMVSHTANEIYETSKNSVGEIITYSQNGTELALGTGFVYSSDGKIITNYHVIEKACSAKITINGVSYTVQKILAYDKDIDLAVLQIEAEGLSVLEICNEEHAVGKAVYAFGSSRGLTATFSQGIITYADREIDGVHYVQHDAAISNGNSGGPLINEYCEIIGINTMTIRDSQNLNFAISVKELSNLEYGNPLTFAQFYEKESDTFTKLKNYILQNGEYDYEDNEYTVSFGYVRVNSTSVYQTGANYSLDDDEIELTLFYTSGSYSYMVFIDIDTVDGTYKWSYIDSSSCFMQGNIYGSTFNSSTILYYTNYSGIYTTSLRNSIRELASTMIRLLIRDINVDYASIGVTASDLGFVNF